MRNYALVFFLLDNLDLAFDSHRSTVMTFYPWILSGSLDIIILVTTHTTRLFLSKEIGFQVSKNVYYI